MNWSIRSAAGTAIVLLVLTVEAVWLYVKRPSAQHNMSLNNLIEPEMVVIPAGDFWMGSSDDKSEHHRVTIAKAFELGKYEVTFDEYDKFANAEGLPLPTDQGWGRGRLPVINVSWFDAVAYTQWLSKMTGKQYRLPTEAEWEYACRTGKETTYCFDGDEAQLGDYAWYIKNAEGRTHPVGQKKANRWGLYDMSGNVWEWVRDSWHHNYEGAPVDGSAWVDAVTWVKENGIWVMKGSDLQVLHSSGRMVQRGGAWLNGENRLPSVERGADYPQNGDVSYGFRLARTLP